MPIKPENRKKYPKDWKAIREKILARADNRCEGGPHYPNCWAENGEPHPVTGSIVVLTIAHLNHKPEDCRPENLRAWCQRCHNAYDAPHRAQNRKIAQLEKDIRTLLDIGGPVFTGYQVNSPTFWRLHHKYRYTKGK